MLIIKQNLLKGKTLMYTNSYDSDINVNAASTTRLSKVKESMDQLHHLIENTRSRIYHRNNKVDTPTQAKTQYSTNIKNYYTSPVTQQPSINIEVEPKQNLPHSRSSKYHIKIDDKDIKSKIDFDFEIKHKQPYYISERYRNQNQKYQSEVNERVHKTLFTFTDRNSVGNQSQQSPYNSKFKNEKSERNFSEIILNDSVPQYSRQSSYIRNQQHNYPQFQRSQNTSKSKSPQVYDYSLEVHQPRTTYEWNSAKPYIQRQKSLQKKLYDSMIAEQRQKKQHNKYKIAKNPQTPRNRITPKNYLMNQQQKSNSRNKCVSRSINLKDYSKNRIKTQNSMKKNDLFQTNKDLYLNRLRKQQMQKQRSKVSMKRQRSYSGKKKHSLSPKCEQVTQRLYKNKHKYPCQRCQKHHKPDMHFQMKKVLQQYSFIRRYLSDRQINDIMVRFEQQGLPKQKWPVEIVNVVYKKLKFLHVK